MSGGHAAADPPLHAGLSVQGLTYGFEGEEPLFKGLDLEVPEGQFVSIVAASGMGKTTLFRLLAGLLQPESGTIKAAGAVQGQLGQGVHGAIGYMPQRDCLMPWRTVLDNAAIGLELAGVPKREARRRVRELLPELGLAGTDAKYPHELSGGMRQRVSFLRSLLAGGDLLLLDEPFSALDAMTRVSMQQWLLEVWEKHRKTILFITHDIDEALLLSDQVLVAASRPITKLEPLVVDLPRPRTYEATLDERFVSLKRRLLGQLGRIASGGEGGAD
ncbi:ABC transporter ATP-binding protein [Paenibacillus glycanilyticus]|uniref:ABC transporter ATP-binding protein n=1 Tax=Paenibacillus glycanilyticus TaxID=126569 RepID=UPI0020415BEF|nr:ABC transporter ATP-binding protein [Paenibacillus glycanilyticus]MCM3630669.1 ABC transporter ATP-binding protein [Paenibacillus glycanilyticus]